MKNKKLTILLSIFTAIVLSVTTVFAIKLTKPAVVDAKTLELMDTEYEDIYKQGTTVTFKESIVINPLTGETASNGELKFPNGRVYPAGTFTLKDLGTYTLRYYKSQGGEFITYEKSFRVCESLYGLSSDNGSYVGLIENDSETGYHSHTGSDGIFVNLKEGCEFVYNKPIDLKAGSAAVTGGGDTISLANIISIDPRSAGSVSKDGEVFTNYEDHLRYVEENKDKEGYVAPSYQPFANDVTITLTDCYDPTNKVIITLYRLTTVNTSDYGVLRCYVSSSTQEQWSVRYANATTSNQGTVVSFDIDGAASTANKYGGTIPRGQSISGHYGSPTSLAVWNNYGAQNPIQFQYDYARNRIYYTNSSRTNSIVVGDLDNPVIYPNGTFKGFTTGEVYVSVKASSYHVTDINLEVFSVGNDNSDVLKSNINLEKENYSDDKAPVIEIDNTLTVGKNAVNNGYVFGALNSEFTIPSAQAFDMNLIEGSLKCAVYRNYGTDQQVAVSVNNGKFKIDTIDNYTIEYSAVDKSNNVGIATLLVKAKKVETEKGISIVWQDKEIDGTLYTGFELFKNFIKNGVVAGKENVIPAFNIETINLAEALNYKVYAKNGLETVQIGKDNIFVPRYTGDYDIIFEYSDNVYSYVTAYTVKCTVEDGFASFLDVPQLQRYYIKDATYNIEEIPAFTYSDNGPQAHKATVYAIFDGDAENKVKITNLQKVKMSGNKTVQFLLEYNDTKNGVTALPRYTDVVELVDVGFGKGGGGVDATDDDMYMLYKYFKYDEGAFKVQTRNEVNNKVIKDIVYRATAESGDAKLQFVNPIPFYKFTFIFKVTNEYGAFSSVRFTFTSTTDKTKKSVVDIYQEAGFTYFTADGSKPVELKSFDFVSTSNKRMEYIHTSGKLYLGTNIVNYKMPFDDGAVDLDIELVGIRGSAGILITEMCGQQFNNSVHDDKTAPQISYKTSRGNYDMGAIVTITPASFADVLSPIDYSKTTFTVKGPDMAYVTALDGTVLDEDCDYTKTYQIRIEKSGQYTASWKTKDISFNGTSEASYPMTCIDTEAPVITFKDGRGENSIIEMSMNEVIKLDYEVVDNSTPIEKLVIFVNAIYVPTQSYGFIDLGNEFNLRLHGDWIVYVVAYDENWNMATKSFTVRII